MPHSSCSSRLVVRNNSGQRSRYRQKRAPSQVTSEPPRGVTSGLALPLATEPPAMDQCGKEQSPFRKSSLLHCPAAAGPSASAPQHVLCTPGPAAQGCPSGWAVPQAGLPRLEGCCPSASQAVSHSLENDKETYSKPGFYLACHRL